jgi:DNA ligase-1
MKEFAALYLELDATTRTLDKIAALKRYLQKSEPADAAWAVFFLTGRTLPKVVGSGRLRQWAAQEAGIEPWLFQECYDAVGDLAETIALILPPPTQRREEPLRWWVETMLEPLHDRDEEEKRRAVIEAWRSLDASERFVWNKLLTGAFRVGVARRLVVRALAETLAIAPDVIEHRLMGLWRPEPEFFTRLTQTEGEEAQTAARVRPYPFCLAHALETASAMLASPLGRNDSVGLIQAALGPVDQWVAEWKWDGIRGQWIKRQGVHALWTRGEELVTDRYPELAAIADRLPDGLVLDGELLPWRDNRPLAFGVLQTRIGRKHVTKSVLKTAPVIFLAFDLLEWDGEDWRERPLEQRRARLAEVVARVDRAELLRLSPRVEASSWEELALRRAEARQHGAEGLMLKRRGSPYRVGRVKGDWWKWKVDPLTIDAVLVAAQRGSGKRASLYSDQTFAVWDDQGRLVPIAKAYSGLDDHELKEVDAWIRAHARESFGPVRSVEPVLVFELGFEGLQRSSRHKSGVATRFPRILRWRRDKRPEQADNLATLLELLPPEPASSTKAGPVSQTRARVENQPRPALARSRSRIAPPVVRPLFNLDDPEQVEGTEPPRSS